MEESSMISTLVIKYQIVDMDGTAECLPIDIKPQVSLNDYEINFEKETQTIKSVKNKEMGSVLFRAISVDQDCGYVQGSVVQLWTAEYKEDTLNIIHMHVNDMSDEVPVDVVYMHKGETVENHREFAYDVSGRMLRYKILIKDMKVAHLLYNEGHSVEEIPFSEQRINKGDLKTIQSCTLSPLPMMVELTHIPICMLACEDKEKLSGLM